ncbi:DUF2946 domain-containing protein [Pseudomonas cavernicola]|uniref:DUF2946 domain-containing protein n=1 Tax=Pseudomonas cavernicola TaxID=2320866 RepID=A0A418XCL8_9PSED|nr:DUF2946 domain-containing protein [Pseudomonas cavernicola]RJG10266.1 DUF2946 domain-containing protein [Pseudomonas cavernicola]
MTRHQRQGIGTRLALFAMLLIYVGPLVSQSMPMDHAMPMLSGMDELACSDGQYAPAQQMATTVPHTQKPSAELFMEKCGYCSLLIHSPPLTSPALVTSADLPVSVSSLLVVSQIVPTSPVFPGARTRAPPFPVA